MKKKNSKRLTKSNCGWNVVMDNAEKIDLQLQLIKSFLFFVFEGLKLKKKWKAELTWITNVSLESPHSWKKIEIRDLVVTDFMPRNKPKGMAYLFCLCKGQATTKQDLHCQNLRHQNLVQANKEQIAMLGARRNSQQNEELIIDKGISCISPVAEWNEESHIEESEPEDNQKPHEPTIVPLDLFEEEESDKDPDAKCTWMAFLNNAVGQIVSEPSKIDGVAAMPSFSQEEENIKSVTPENLIWFPFLNKEVSMSLKQFILW